MIKKTLYFGNPAYLSITQQQLVIKSDSTERKIPIEDIGILIIDHYQISITHAVLHMLLENNAAVITCNDKHHPTGLLLNLDGHTLQSEKFKAQINASEPLKKQLWQQTIKAKIANQTAVLNTWEIDSGFMNRCFQKILSGDTSNQEAQASKYYWNNLFNEEEPYFTRERSGIYPNNFLNYGYAVLRATVARGLVSSGLLPTLGIHHSNKYNAYCLADDIMEPYRPYVDHLVKEIINEDPQEKEITTTIKRKLLEIPALNIEIDGKDSPLMVGLQRTTASLAACYEGELKKILYPNFKV
ncbi:MAG TPA: type II CRISPR-associated endonuclease Cas1 [Chitinophagales bacterium]|jgi:CRISPR-associated protein Cas1|nr:type II CRISPR-associated endonuclease Cas1 [Chitinophagales bacterium]